MALEPSGLYYPNRFARIMLQAMEDVMGLHGLNTVLSLSNLEALIDQPSPNDMNRAFDFAAIAAMSHTLEEVYGPRGGRGIALRIGRAMLDQGFKRFGALAGMAHPAFQKLSMTKRTRHGLVALAAVFTRFSDQQTTLNETADHFIVTVNPAPMTWGRNLDQPANHMLTGIIQETLRWATQGYEFHVQEQPPNSDDSTVFHVNNSPIGGVSFG